MMNTKEVISKTKMVTKVTTGSQESLTTTSWGTTDTKVLETGCLWTNLKVSLIGVLDLNMDSTMLSLKLEVKDPILGQMDQEDQVKVLKIGITHSQWTLNQISELFTGK